MLNEKAAMRGVREALGGASVEEIAIAFPVGTTRAQAGGSLKGEAGGAVVGVAADLAGTVVAGTASGGGGVGMFLAQRRLEKEEPAASIVLALTEDSLYLLGRHFIGPFASFKDLSVIHRIPREAANLALSPAGITQHLTIVDENDGTRYVYEVKALGSGIKRLISDLQQQ